MLGNDLYITDELANDRTNHSWGVGIKWVKSEWEQNFGEGLEDRPN